MSIILLKDGAGGWGYFSAYYIVLLSLGYCFSAFLLLYRSAESLFRGILRTKGLDTGNFGTMLTTLADLGLLKNEEQIILNQVRRQRNYILHRAGEKITIQKKFAEDFIRVVENILVRADNLEIK